jgi:hypothetical protein
MLSPEFQIKKIEIQSFVATFRLGRGRNFRTYIEETIPKLRGWVNYFRLAEVKGIFDELAGWLRQKINPIFVIAWIMKQQMRQIGRLLN